MHIAMEQPGEPFPCRAANLKAFLSLSEQFRTAAAVTKVKGASGPLIPDGEAVELGMDIKELLPAPAPLVLKPI